MVDAAVRPSETPTAEPHIDAELVTRMLLGTWADTRREAREMIKDPAQRIGRPRQLYIGHEKRDYPTK